MLHARMDITPSGYFLARASTIGSTNEELSDLSRGIVTKERAREIAFMIEAAARSLDSTEPLGSC